MPHHQFTIAWYPGSRALHHPMCVTGNLEMPLSPSEWSPPHLLLSELSFSKLIMGKSLLWVS